MEFSDDYKRGFVAGFRAKLDGEIRWLPKGITVEDACTWDDEIIDENTQHVPEDVS